MSERFAIPGSAPVHTDRADWRAADPNLRLSPTLVIRRPERTGDLVALTRDEAETLLRADEADLQAVRTFAAACGLAVVAENANARTVQVEGTILSLGTAFGVAIEWCNGLDGQQHLSYCEDLSLPSELSGIVTAVLGLDQRPVARVKHAHS